MTAPEDQNGLREALARAVAANLKRRRGELGLSLQDVAAAAGLTKAHVWGIESGGTANPSLGTVVGLAEALRMSVAEFLGLEIAAEAAWSATERAKRAIALDAMVALDQASENLSRALAAEAEITRLKEGMEGLLPKKLCGEISTTPDDERVSITVTFGAIRRARATLSPKEQP